MNPVGAPQKLRKSCTGLWSHNLVNDVYVPGLIRTSRPYMVGLLIVYTCRRTRSLPQVTPFNTYRVTSSLFVKSLVHRLNYTLPLLSFVFCLIWFPSPSSQSSRLLSLLRLPNNVTASTALHSTAHMRHATQAQNIAVAVRLSEQMDPRIYVWTADCAWQPPANR